MLGLQQNQKILSRTKKSHDLLNFNFKDSIKDWLECGLSVAILENPLVWLLLGIFGISILILSQLLFTRALVNHANIKFSELDQNLGQIITDIIENNAFSLDPENQITPIQAFFMDLVKEKMNPPISVTKIEQQRDDSGKFA